jgi:5-methylcytosine-specific restriction enzyme subunit McrC
MSKIVIIEHQNLRIGRSFDPINNQISTKDAEYLKQLEGKQGVQIFKWGSNTVSPQQWAGIISVPNGVIEILPKITDDENRDMLRDKLVYMLQIVNDVPVRKNITSKLDYGTHGFVDLLIQLFLIEFEKQIRHGIFKTYQKRIDNLNTIKGTMDYPRNLRTNQLLKNKFVCKYSRFTEDNPLNQIIKYTLRLLQKITKSPSNQSMLKKLDSYFENVTYSKKRVSDIESVILNRHTQRFKETLDFCKLFISGQELNFSTGEVTVQFMLFDMNQLFERFVYKMYKRAIKNGKVFYQNAHHYMLSSNASGLKVLLKPDLIIEQGIEKILLDTKWKNISRFADESDIYQMNAYLDCIPHLTGGILLYPKTTKNDKIVGDYSILRNNEQGLLKIRTIDLSMSGENPAFFNYLLQLLV